ncbi:hypothetical protein F5888DRAFT_1741549 [Russula emetica]|nr:hypothetical protein F5888DRAFT_1741549 [Russula emetica]
MVSSALCPAWRMACAAPGSAAPTLHCHSAQGLVTFRNQPRLCQWVYLFRVLSESCSFLFTVPNGRSKSRRFRLAR